MRIKSFSLAVIMATLSSVSICAWSTGRNLPVITETTGPTTKGRVLNVEDDSPVRDVNVLVLWRKNEPTLHGSHVNCLHAELATTNRWGYWKIRKSSSRERTFYDTSRSHVRIFMHKPGYSYLSSFGRAKGRIYENDSPDHYYSILLYDSDEWVKVGSLMKAKKLVGYGNSYLKPSDKPNFKELVQIVNSATCDIKGGTAKAVQDFFEHIHKELSVKATTENEKNLVDRIAKRIERIK